MSPTVLGSLMLCKLISNADLKTNLAICNDPIAVQTFRQWAKSCSSHTMWERCKELT